MKYYKKILDEQIKGHFFVIEHIWGQTEIGVYNEFASVWNSKAIVGDSIFILSRKNYGVKSLVTLMKEKGLNINIVGKGEDDIRLLQIGKESSVQLKSIAPNKRLIFNFQGITYDVDPGQAIFSRSGLDDGTNFLLETFLSIVKDLNGKIIGDLGAGWGAISLVLATTSPGVEIIAFENEFSSIEAFLKNTAKFENIRFFISDISSLEDNNLKKYNEKLDYIVSNPPFHITTGQRDGICRNMWDLMKKNGEVFIVTEGRFAEMYKKSLSSSFEIKEIFEYKRYKVFRCIK